MNRPDGCNECGRCVAVCPVERAGGRSAVSFLAGGPRGDVWLCASCWRCQDECPAGVDIHELIMGERRRLAAPEGYRQAFENVLACGYALCVGPEVNEVRAVWGLEPVELAEPGVVEVLLADESRKLAGISSQVRP
jgi:heterodisulfide reductase subunit C